MVADEHSMVLLTVIVIAQNEEANIRYCLRSVREWCVEVYVVDSFSADQTAVLAQEEGAIVVEHLFQDWAAQRNWALSSLPIKTDWVLFLDADEQLTDDLKREVEQVLIKAAPPTAAFAIRQSLVFLRHHLRHAQDGPPLVRLVRRTRARWFCQGAREYCRVDGSVGELHSRIWHEDHKGLAAWIEKQNRNATREAQLLWERRETSGAVVNEAKTSERRLRVWVRDRIWQRLPLFLRPLLYFLYRYVLRGGFLDGQAGLAYTFLQGFWLSFLADAKYYELIQVSKHVEAKLPEPAVGTGVPYEDMGHL
jgi:glycosyltransferase involved in cell wall biosynthesis